MDDIKYLPDDRSEDLIILALTDEENTEEKAMSIMVNEDIAEKLGGKTGSSESERVHYAIQFMLAAVGRLSASLLEEGASPETIITDVVRMLIDNISSAMPDMNISSLFITEEELKEIKKEGINLPS